MPGDTTKITIRGLTMTCWNCGNRTTVVVGLHPAAAVTNDELLTCDNEPTLAAAADLLQATGNVGLARPIKPRANRTTAHTYLSNGCQHCDALQGNFFIYHEELLDALSANGLDGLEHLTDADMPTDLWQRLHEHWASGAP